MEAKVAGIRPVNLSLALTPARTARAIRARAESDDAIRMLEYNSANSGKSNCSKPVIVRQPKRLHEFQLKCEDSESGCDPLLKIL